MINYNELISNCQKEIQGLNPNYKFTEECQRIEKTYYDKIPQWIENYNNENKIKSCLDIGCAFGTLLLATHKISGCELYALEILNHLSNEMIEKYNIEYDILNFELQRVIFSKKKFDVILFTEVIEHLKFNPIPTMWKIYNLLNKNGRVFMSCPNVAVWGKIDKYNSYKDMPMPGKFQELEDLGHEYHYSLEELKEIFNSTKFEIVNLGYSPGESESHFNFELKKM